MAMKHSPAVILQEMAAIQQMERGTLCRMRKAPVGHYYNHQTWEKGRNVVRYVPRDQIQNLKNAIAGYLRFLKLSQAYADEIIHCTRLTRKS